jgi:hypothetical protein
VQIFYLIMALFANSEVFLGDFGHVRGSPGVHELQIESDVSALPKRSPHGEQVQVANGRDGHVGNKGYVVVGDGLRLPHALQVTLAAVQIDLLAPTKNKSMKKFFANKSPTQINMHSYFN